MLGAGASDGALSSVNRRAQMVEENGRERSTLISVV